MEIVAFDSQDLVVGNIEVVTQDHALENVVANVQERGLYFPNEWDAAYTPILSMHDKNEKSSEGSLLIAQYGKGHYIYTGLSFFRELPAGVSGAFRLFANMLSVGKNNQEIKP